MRRFLTLFLIMLLIITSFIIKSLAGEEKSILEFTIDDAIQYAKENTETLKIADLEIDKQQLALKEAKREYKNFERPDIPGYRPTIDEQFGFKLIQEGYKVDASEMALLLAEKGKEISEELLNISVKNVYFDVLYNQEKIKIKELNLQRAQRQYKNTNTKFDLGTVTKQDVLTAEANLESAKLELANAMDDLEYAKMNFNKTIGLPINTKIVLTEKLKYEPLQEIKIEEKVSEALENRLDVIKAKEGYSLQKLNYKITTSFYPENTYKAKQALFDKEKSYNQLIQTEKDAEIEVRKSYLDLVKAERNIKGLEKNIESLKEAYRLTSLSYEVGIATSVDVMNVQQSLNEAELGYLQALHGYNMAKLNFEASYKVGLSTGLN